MKIYNILTTKLTESTVDKNIGLLRTIPHLEGHLYMTLLRVWGSPQIVNLKHMPPPSGLLGFLLINAVSAKTSIVIGDLIIIIRLLWSKMTPAESKLVIFNHSDSKGGLQIPDLTGSKRIIQLTKCVSCPLPGLR